MLLRVLKRSWRVIVQVFSESVGPPLEKVSFFCSARISVVADVNVWRCVCSESSSDRLLQLPGRSRCFWSSLQKSENSQSQVLSLILNFISLQWTNRWVLPTEWEWWRGDDKFLQTSALITLGFCWPAGEKDGGSFTRSLQLWLITAVRAFSKHSEADPPFGLIPVQVCQV